MKFVNFLKGCFWPLSRKTFLAVIALVCLYWAVSIVFGAAYDTASAIINRRLDAKSDTVVQTEKDKAAAAETNANDASVNRRITEARADDAQAEKATAAQNSNLTLAPSRAARQRYEETRRNPVDPDAADMSDADLCAELARRNIVLTAGCQ